MTISTADLWDERGEELAGLSMQLRNLGGTAAFTGPIRTVQCFQDNALLRSVLGEPGDGAVLVVDGAGSLETALLGDQIAQLALEHGWSGVVVHGAVRDSVVLATLPLGVKALGTNPRTSDKEGTGAVDVPVTFGGVVFTPGKTLWSDEDGVLVER
jgi:regulator of ribonuclease activity A